ncbi:MAG: hypothetical protein JWQ85_3969 [Mucilaginibacter sp.]|nr:hypothetical protein [Mucilaginibacter sp.]
MFCKRVPFFIKWNRMEHDKWKAYSNNMAQLSCAKFWTGFGLIMMLRYTDDS